MTIKEAITEARKEGNWINVPPLEPVVVEIVFQSYTCPYERVELELMNEDKESELDALWNGMYEEVGAVSEDSVKEVEVFCI